MRRPRSPIWSGDRSKSPTLYAEFVNKEGLFRAVLDRYISRFAAKHEAVLFAEGKSVDRALRDYFTAVATCFTSKETPAGCFIINTSAALAASSTDIANTIKSRHAMQEQALTQFLQQRQAQGELPAGRDVAQLAQFLNCVLQGMSISAGKARFRQADANHRHHSPSLAAGPRV